MLRLISKTVHETGGFYFEPFVDIKEAFCVILFRVPYYLFMRRTLRRWEEFRNFRICACMHRERRLQYISTKFH